MAMNRIQFQTGLSLPSFLEQYGTEAQCEAALESVRWYQGFRADCLVFGNLLGQSSQDGLVSSGVETSVGCELSDRLAFSAEVDASYVRT